MPRGATSAKRHQGSGPNQRDTRHENGSVAPGKRVSKQKSQTHLNGGAKGSSAGDDASAPAVPPSPGVPQGYARHGAAAMDGLPVENKVTESLRRGSLGTYSESSSSESYHGQAAHGVSEDNHRRIDVNATKNSNVHRDTGPLDFALTVLRSCPLQDTIAILIILMQIPPIALSGIYMLFTLLTFVTTSNGLTLSDVFEWNLGAPSVATVVCVDGIVLLIWLFLWGPIQHVILDLAQMVIALGLGGGSSSRDGGSMKNTLICLSMILLSHVLRHTKMKYSPIGYLLGSSRFIVSTPDLDDPLESIVPIRGYDRVQSGWVNWVRSILAIHILTQGLIKYIRDWYLRRERRDNPNQSADPEAGKAYSGDFTNDGGFSTPDSDAASIQQSTALNSKKKRKQSAQIRNRQPLWAAIASTKIVVVKEYELSHSAADSAGANATDIHNLGNAPFNTEPDQIWISYIGCDEVCFNTSHFPDHLSPQDGEDGTAGSSRYDLTKPFYVRVNNAVWQPTRLAPVCEQDSEQDPQLQRWGGDIYGLTPMSNYDIEFVSTTTHHVILHTSVRTTQAKTADVDVAAIKPGGQRSLRPDSPTTTLKTSIAVAESKLTEEKARQKALKKEWNRKINALKKENEKLSSTVLSAGTGDDKLRQKIQQNSTQQKQAEQATADLEGDLKDVGVVPESLKSSWKSKQAAYAEEKAKYDKAHGEFKKFKSSLDNNIKSLADEKSSLEAKRNKISSRIAKVEGEHARIADANARGLDEAERRRQNRVNQEASIAKYERELMDKIHSIEARLQEKDQIIGSMRTQLDGLHQQQSAYYTGNLDFDPSSMLPPMPTTSGAPGQSIAAPYDATSAWNNSAYNASLWGPSPLAPGFVPQQSSPLSQVHMNPAPLKFRGRSSSMLSDVSGFTQSSANDDEFLNSATLLNAKPAAPFGGYGHQSQPTFGYPPRGPFSGDAENGSVGSGSPRGSGSAGSTGSDSYREPLSP